MVMAKATGRSAREKATYYEYDGVLEYITRS